jgi:hypothetical protein
MKTLEKKAANIKDIKVNYDPSLDNLPIPNIALKRAEEAREFLKKHPIPEHILRGTKS